MLQNKSKKKILVSSQDIGATKTIVEFLKYIEKKEIFNLYIVCSKITYEVYKKLNYKNIIIYSTRANKKKKGLKKILASANSILLKVKPDVLFVGLSGPDLGIDEALIYKSQNIPNFAFQDFWGDMNNGFGKFPKTIFVMDKFAKKITSLKYDKAEVIIAGLSQRLIKKILFLIEKLLEKNMG